MPSPRALGDLPAGRVAQHHPGAGGAARLGRVLDGAGGAVEAGHHGDVGQVDRAGLVQPDRSVDAGVVEEVVPVPLPRTGRGVLDDARRDRLEAQRVVDQDGDAGQFAGEYVFGDISRERRVAALMRDHLRVADPHPGTVGGRLEVQHDPPAVPAAGDPDGGLVPDVAEVVAYGGVDRDVVEAGRYSHLAGVRRAGRRTTVRCGPRRPGRARTARVRRGACARGWRCPGVEARRASVVCFSSGLSPPLGVLPDTRSTIVFARRSC